MSLLVGPRDKWIPHPSSLHAPIFVRPALHADEPSDLAVFLNQWEDLGEILAARAREAFHRLPAAWRLVLDVPIARRLYRSLRHVSARAIVHRVDRLIWHTTSTKRPLHILVGIMFAGVVLDILCNHR